MKRLLLTILGLSFGIIILHSQGVQFQLKVFLQGPFQPSGSMSQALGASGYLPLAQPYHTGIWNYTGTESLTAIPSGMVDWVLVDLRISPDTAVARMAAILYADGTVKDINGNANLYFNIPSGTYYVAVMHRSHLSSMSGSRLVFPVSGTLDFTDTTAFAVYGRCLISMSGGVTGMISGDLNNDKVLKYSGSGNDRSLILQKIIAEVGGTALNSTTSGYHREDLRMDGVVKYSGAGNDQSLIIQNIVNLTGSTAINATFTGSVPHAVLYPAALQTFRSCGDLLTDIRDFQQYPTLLIGDQCWMGKNLNIGVMVSSTNTGADHSNASNNGVIEKYCYNNDINNCDTFGGLYDWDEAMQYSTIPGAMGICPEGWHIPNIEEWNAMEDSLGGISLAGGKLKEAGLLHWSSPNTGATNESGFTALPAGFRSPTGYFNTLGTHACFWSSTLQQHPYIWNRTLLHNNESIFHYSDFRTRGHSIRCIMDSIPPCTPQPDQANAGPDRLNVQGVSVTLQANEPSNGSGSWSIAAGQGGSFGNPMAYNSSFSGHPGAVYTLVWTISTVCGSTSDSVLIGFACDPQYVPATAGPDQETCPGDCVTLTAGGGVSYQWSTQEVTTVIQVCPTQTTTYVVTVTDHYGCTAAASAVVTVHPLPVPNIGQDAYICPGQCATLQASGGVSYLWSTQETTSSITVCPGANTVYAVTVTDMHGCQGTDEVSIFLHTPPQADAGADTAICMGDCAILHATGGVSYIWSNQEVAPDIVVCPTQNTTYQVTVTGANGCTASSDVVVTILTLPTAHAVTDTSICPSGCAPLLASGGISYLWSTQETTAGIVVCPPQTTTYHVTVADTNGCQDTASVTVTLLELPFASAGPDTLNVPDTIIILQGSQLSNATGLWSVISGGGGAFSDPTLPNASFSGLPDTLYVLMWTVTNVCGSATDTVNVGFSPVASYPCEGLILDDRDEQTYPVLQIGSQCWMGSNLNIGSLITSSWMGGAIYSNASDNGIIEKYCYDNNTANCDIYGGLYDWNEMMDYVLTPGARGICPDGWHIPTDAEWKMLEGTVDSQFGVGDQEWNYFGWRGQDVGGKLKHAGTDYWLTPNVGANNETGFTALPAGLRFGVGWYGNKGSNTYFWTSTPHGTENAYYRWLGYTQPGMWRDIDRKRAYGFSVRCLRDTDCDVIPDQANAGPDTFNIPDIYIQLQANQPTQGTGVWSIASGSGGQFINTTQNNTLFLGQSGEAYQLVWTIMTNCLGYSDTVDISFAMVNVPECDSVLLDTRDSTVYPVVRIGNQCWMAKNLNVGTFATSVFTHWHNVHSDVSNNGIIEKYCYNNDTANCGIWGGLYDWDEMMNYVYVEGTQGICPPANGWHIPSDNEWKIMEGNIDSYHGVGDPVWDLDGVIRGSDAGGNLKEEGYTHWDEPNFGATNSSGFTAIPSGLRYFAGVFQNLNDYTMFWTSTQYPTVPEYAYYRGVSSSTSNLARSGLYKPYGFSVRCVKELPPCVPAADQANAGPDSLEIAGSIVQMQATQPAVGIGKWTIKTGYGGQVHDPMAHNSIFHGLPGEEYVLRWTVSNVCGSSHDEVVISFADTLGFQCGDSLVDVRDGKKYPTVQIGIYCWMASNLNVGDFVQSVYDGIDHTELTNNGIIEKFCLDNNPALCDVYGGLYSWDEMMAYSTVEKNDGICPPNGGWRLPTDEDWKVTEGSVDILYGIGDAEWDNDYSYRGWDAGAKLMDGTPSRWNSLYGSSLVGTDDFGFRVIPGESRTYDGWMNQDVKYNAYFWTSTHSGWHKAWMRMFSGDNEGIYRVGHHWTNNGFSVRCLKDMPQSCAPQPDQAQAGPDSTDIQGASFVLQANQPSAGAGLWTILSGSAGSFSDPSMHNDTFTGVAGQTYVLEWRITTICGTSADTIILSFAAPVIQTCGVLVDTRDGQQYPTVIIGTKCWMAKNLNIGTMVNSLPGGTHSDVSNNGIIEKYCFANDTNNCLEYGGLYDWNEMVQYQINKTIQGICPDGWRLPFDSDWTSLVNSLGGASTAGGSMKEAGLSHWSSPNTDATNVSGFTALGGGWRTYNGFFSYLKSAAQFWSVSSVNSSYAWGRNLGAYSGEVSRYDSHKFTGASVRCVKDVP
ncbi:MAG: hypothetical protein KA053_02675 [Lentimicrobiaceae bacterium]|nr:hypothetical protein [Lentimicrobiaceae bacterium]